jgi:energy-converting hydrogenase Eha subunit F
VCVLLCIVLILGFEFVAGKAGLHATSKQETYINPFPDQDIAPAAPKAADMKNGVPLPADEFLSPP